MNKTQVFQIPWNNLSKFRKNSARKGCNNDWGRNPNQPKYLLSGFCLNFQWTLCNQQHFSHKRNTREQKGVGRKGRYAENMLT